MVQSLSGIILAIFAIVGGFVILTDYAGNGGWFMFLAAFIILPWFAPKVSGWLGGRRWAPLVIYLVLVLVVVPLTVGEAAQKKGYSDTTLLRQIEVGKDLEAKRQASCSNGVAAFIAAQSFVRDSLKTPSTAKFPDSQSASISKIGACSFRVVSFVDAQNLMGAMVRSNYQVDIERDLYTEKWSLLDIVIE